MKSQIFLSGVSGWKLVLFKFHSTCRWKCVLLCVCWICSCANTLATTILLSCSMSMLCLQSALLPPCGLKKKSVHALLNCGANSLEYRQSDFKQCELWLTHYPLWAYRTYCCSSVSPATWRRCLTGMLLIAALAHTSYYHQDFIHCGCQNTT